MTELELYKFIHEEGISWNRAENKGYPDVLIFPYVFQLEDFCKLLKKYKFDDGGLEIRLLDGYVAIWMQDLCDYFDIEMNNIFVDNP
jgi:hypothetical protein